MLSTADPCTKSLFRTRYNDAEDDEDNDDDDDVDDGDDDEEMRATDRAAENVTTSSTLPSNNSSSRSQKPPAPFRAPPQTMCGARTRDTRRSDISISLNVSPSTHYLQQRLSCLQHGRESHRASPPASRAWRPTPRGHCGPCRACFPQLPTYCPVSCFASPAAASPDP